MFANFCRIISEQGSAFKSKGFTVYCVKEGIELVKITTVMPRGNGQVEIIHRIYLYQF